MRLQLLCTFTHVDRITSCIDMIESAYSGVADVECYSYVYQPSSVICIYGADPTTKRLKDTIAINRKKETNTFYSINALNGLIRHLNNGNLDKSYRIEWHDYSYSLLLADGDYGYRSISIEKMTQ